MDKFIAHENIVRYTKLLITEADTTKREMLQRLLAEEMVKQATHPPAKT